LLKQVNERDEQRHEAYLAKHHPELLEIKESNRRRLALEEQSRPLA
jgi:hypothetical protein